MNIITIDKKIKEFAENTPNKVAIEYRNMKVTYKELEEESNKISNFLIDNYKEIKNVFVIMEKSHLLIEALVGIIKSGGIFVPIDCDYSDNKIVSILDEVKADWIITTPNLMKKMSSITEKVGKKFNVLLVKDNAEIENTKINNLRVFLIENYVRQIGKIYQYSHNKHCYIYFTSGSTGKPKCVLGRHKSLMQFVEWEIKEMGVTCKSRISQLTPVTFDPFLRDVFVPLCSGGTICIPHSKEIILNPIKLINWLEEKQITLIHMVPSLFKIMMSEIKDIKKLRSLQYILLAGEILRGNDIKKFIEISENKIQLVNLYGPTETTLAKLFYRINNDDVNKSIIPVGKPIDFAEVFILNENLQRCVNGVVGCIYIRTPFITSGYCNDKERTREAFIRNPFSDNSNDIIYKTGDLGRKLFDGNIEILGREDNQVKIRGIRIELGEIENRLLQYDCISEASVIPKEDEFNDKYLYAYIVSNIKVNKVELKKYLLDYFPQYMIPAYFIQLEEMPLNQNQKIDRRKLISMEDIVEEVEYTKPINKIEQKLLDIWSDLLKVKKISTNSSFFDIGGHSLKVAKLIAEIYKQFNVEISFTDVFNNPTIKEVSEYIKKAKKNKYLSIKLVEEKEVYKVSSPQKRLFALNQFSKEEVNYNIPFVMMIDGILDGERVKKVFQKLIERHEALRTSFELKNGEVLQKIHKEVEFFVEHIEANEESLKKIVENFIRPFDLLKAPLLRAKIVTIEEKKHVLMIDMHHIISDGTSMGIIMKEFIKLYKGEELEELKIQYKDYAEWQNKILNSEYMKKQEEYWKREFNGEIPILDIPTDYPRPVIQNFEGDSIKFKIDGNLAKIVREIGKYNGATVYMVLLSAYNILLSKYSGQEDIIVGSPIAGRSHVDLQGIVGMFVNTLAIRNYPKSEKTFKEFLHEVKRNMLKVYENQDYQFDEFIEKLNIRRDTSRNALFDTMFILQNTDIEQIDIGNLKFKPYEFNSKVSKFDITLSAMEVGEEIVFKLEYCTKLFKRETIERIVLHFLNILRIVIKNPEIKISEIEMISEEEKKKILVDFNDTKTEYPKDKTIYELFEEQVEKTPNSVAVVHGNKSLTYKELNEKANSLARILREKGIGPDRIVGIMVERSLEMIIGIMGILKSGGAYLPINPCYPQERIQYMLKDSNTSILLTQRHIIDYIKFEGIVIDLEHKSLYERTGENLDKSNKSSNLAYVIYTSGSTGMPKGVMVEHKSAVNLLIELQYKYPLNCMDSYLLKTNYVFDVSITELFGYFLRGGRLIILDQGKESNPKVILELIEKHNITHINFVPSMLRMFIDDICEKDIKIVGKLKYIFVAGEKISKNLMDKIYQLNNNVKFENLYGPTETTIYTTGYSLTRKVDNRSVPIGKPLSNTKIYILGKNNRLQPIGLPGELCISGDGLARGYLNRENLTMEKFVSNQFEAGERMYHTGDIARWMPDGNIEYIGRIDQQVKIRGFRIELGEIESQLLKQKNIKEAVVVDREDKDGNKYLCAYVISDIEITIAEMRMVLSNELPDYMIPTYFMRIEKIPLTPNGKIDREALPESNGDINTGIQYISPRNMEEEILTGIWSNVLSMKKEKIGIDHDFFMLGGHSLKAIQVASMIYRELNVEVSISEIFSNPTIRQIEEYIKKSKKSIYSSIKVVEEKEVYRVSSAQKRLFALNQFNKEDVNYNISAAMVLEGKLEIDRLKKVFYKIIGRHEAFRTSFELENDEIIQRIHKEVGFNIEYAEVNEDNEDTVRKMLELFVRPFNLSKAPLLRIKLVKLKEQKHMLMIDMHHIISDGESIDILMREFVKLYRGEELEKLRIQYKDYTAWQNEILNSEDIKRQEKYWMKIFSDEIPVLDMPTDYQRPTVQSSEGESIRFKIDKELTRKLRKLEKDRRITLYMILLSTYNVLLSKYSGQEDIIVGSPITGRSHADLQGLVGMFVNTLAMRNYPKSEKTFKEFLEDVKKNSLSAYENQDYQFEDLIEKLDVRRDISRNPLFDTMFVLQNIDVEGTKINDIKIRPYEFNKKVSKFDITLSAMETDEEITFKLEYCTKLFKKETIERMKEHFINILRKVIENPEIKISEIEILSEEEKKKILVDFNDTKAEYPRNKTLHELFEEQVEKTPDNIAAVYKDKGLTYIELNEKANSLARALRKKGIGTDDIVGIMVERSLEMIIGIIGILKAGGTYLPIDPSYPQSRITYTLEDSGTNIMLTQNHLMDKIEFEGEVIDLENKELYEGNKDNLMNISNSNNLAYIIYTSGTTGNPKGVMIEHKNVVRLLFNEKIQFRFNEKDVWTMFHSFCFDFSAWEMYGALLYGGKLIVVPKITAKDTEEYLKLLKRERVTVLNQVPSAFYNLMNKELECSEKELSIRYVIFGGEALKPGILKEWSKKYTNTKLINMYGITETTVHVTFKKLIHKDLQLNISNIGRPIPTLTTYIMDKNMKLLPIGVKGELCIGGEGVGRGYINRDKLTEEKFIINPYKPSERLYRSGDLAKWLPNGELEYLGRIDNQVKIRGFRIEIGEIENQLLKCEEIKETIVVDRDDKAGNKYLCAYIVCNKEMTVTEIRSVLAKKIPDYMIPAYFIRIEKMPLTQNGKADRRALPEPDRYINTGVEYVAPENEIEEKLISVWKEVLDVDKIGIDDDFFALGGDSIKAIQISAKLCKHNLKITVNDLFANSTIRELSLYVKQDNEEINQDTIEGQVELVAIQKWFFEEKFKNMHHWNQAFMLYSKEGFDEKIISKVFSKIVEHHDALRMVIREEEDKIIQYNRGIEGKLFDLVVKDFRNKESYEEEIEEEANKIQSSINLTYGPIVKLGLFKTKNGDHLLIVIHHVVVDGVSWRVLLEDFATGYKQILNKEKIKLPLKTNSFKEWSDNIQNYSMSNKLLNEIEYWKNIEDTEVQELPIDGEVINDNIYNSRSILIKISKENTNKLLKDAGKAYNTEINDILLAALGLTVKAWSGGNKILVSLEGHGREEILPNMNITRTIGWFTSAYPVIIDCKMSNQIGYYLKSVKEGLRKIPNRGIGYSILKYITPKSYMSNLEFKLNPQISFNYLGQFDNDINQEVFSRSSISIGDAINKEAKRLYNININSKIINHQLWLNFEYNKDQYQRETIVKFADNYEEVLLDIIKHCIEKEKTEMTPSDFDYNELSIEELEDIKSML